MPGQKALGGFLNGPVEHRFVTRNVSGGRNEDRLVVVQAGGRLMAVVADGAGGVGNAARTAQDICLAAEQEMLTRRQHEVAWDSFLGALDVALSARGEGGESTAVVVEFHDGEVRGASVGDSGVWMLGKTGALELSGGQVRKPLIGTGLARPVPFGPRRVEGRVLLATDGLWKCAAPPAIAAAACVQDLDGAADALVDAVRLKSGGLQDDVALVLVELAPGQGVHVDAERAERVQWFAGYVDALDNQSQRCAGGDGPVACPCCGFLTLGERGGFEICPVCFWEDDGQDDADAALVRGGPNGSLSLEQARTNYRAIGACEPRCKQHVRPPRPEEIP